MNALAAKRPRLLGKAGPVREANSPSPQGRIHRSEVFEKRVMELIQKSMEDTQALRREVRAVLSER